MKRLIGIIREVLGTIRSVPEALGAALIFLPWLCYTILWLMFSRDARQDT